MDSENGEAFIKHLAYFVRTHEKALANALQLRRLAGKGGVSTNAPTSLGTSSVSLSDGSSYAQDGHQVPSTPSTLAAALSLPSLSFGSHSLKPATLELTAHHLFYLLSRFEDLGVPVGAMNIRLENIHADIGPGNYVSFLSQHQQSARRGSDRDSIHSVSSVRSVMSGMSSLWSSFGLGSKDSASKTEKAKLALETDLKYLYSSFTKIPCLRLCQNRRARLIRGYEEFPFDTAVPLIAFKNLSALEIVDVDFRHYYGWDRLADQLRSLTIKRASLEDPAELLIDIVLDDMDKRRRRSSKQQISPVIGHPEPKRYSRHIDLERASSAPGSPKPDKLSASASPKAVSMIRGGSEGTTGTGPRPRPRSISPTRLAGHNRSKSTAHRARRSGSNSSQSSAVSVRAPGSSSSNLLGISQLPASKWSFLKHLCIADNALTTLTAASLAPIAQTLHSLDLHSNLFQQIPDALATLTGLRALNLSGCMIESLHSLTRNPLPAITALNLRNNRLTSLAGVEKLPSLERLDLRGNRLNDPTEAARLTNSPDIREIWVSGNNFTKQYDTYRIIIFNLFRKTPGYTEDVLIDSTGPSYSERKHLCDRAVEISRTPVIRPIAAVNTTTKHEALQVNKPLPHTPSITQEKMITPGSVEGAPIAAQRRRKHPKRRIVELSRQDFSPPSNQRILSTSFTQESPSQLTQDAPVPNGHSSFDDKKSSPLTNGFNFVDSKKSPLILNDLNSLDSKKSPVPNGSSSLNSKKTPPQPSPTPAAPPLSDPSHATPSAIKETIITPPTQRPSLISPLSPRSPPIRTTSTPLPLLDTSMAPPPRPSTTRTPSIQNTLATPLSTTRPTPPDWATSGEIYKRKMEALRSEVGNGWLNVLSEDSAAAAAAAAATTTSCPFIGDPLKRSATTALSPASPLGAGDFSPASTIRPSPTTPRASAQPARTLG
ncbi:MAG: hypothetical protein M1814_006359 [Vezdaea aestivalis]|nr:MAG: hypothetical protein M1814_006359 [Vezdaea aestivalis]